MRDHLIQVGVGVGRRAGITCSLQNSSAYCRLNCNDTFSLVLIDYTNLTCGRFANDDGRFLKHVGSDIDANTFRFVVSLVTNDSDGVCSAWKMNRVASDCGFQSLFLP